MARKPARPTARRRPAKIASDTAAKAASPADLSVRERILHAFMALLAEQSFEEIGLGDIAGRAGISLADLRGEFSSTMYILAAHIKETDRKVLAGGDADLAEEPARERLFDVLMRRFEAMAPHRDAIRSLVRSARRNPPLALALNGLAVRSQQWMLTAADIPASGPAGMLRAQGLALLFARVLRTFLHDEDEGLARTMAALDRELARGQRFAELLDGACRLSPLRLLSRRSRRRRDEDTDDEPVAA
jgi:AcrR family transcriptional regulator